jgi:hypothetical protein
LALNVEEIGRFLGQTIEDSMGRNIGKLVGLTADIKDNVQAIQVAYSDGEVNQYPINAVKIIDGHLALVPSWRVDADDLRREHDIIKRRSQALDLLVKDGDIDNGEYNQLRNSYEDLNKEIINKREKLVETLIEVETRLNQQVRDLQTALTNNKMLYTASEIDEPTYRTVTESIRAGLEIARKETKDLDNTRNYLQEIGTLESPKAVPSSPIATEIPDVVVIKMKEAA